MAGPEVLVRVTNEGLKHILENLKFCPMCAYQLTNVFMLHGIVTKECPNHEVVYVIFPSINGYEIKVVLDNG